MIDINIWLALTWDKHPQHMPAARWFESIDGATLLFCRLTMLGFLRLLTNRQVMGGSTVTLAAALALYDRWRQDPRVELAVEARSTEARFRDALALHLGEPATKAVAGCYLVGFANAAGATLVTFDKALATTARSQEVDAVLLEVATVPSSRSRRR